MTTRADTRGLVDHLTYTVDLSKDVPPGDIDRVARDVASGRLYAASPEAYLSAIQDALRDRGPGARQGAREHHLRTFFTGLGTALEAAQPWPPPPYRSLPVSDHLDLVTAPVVLRIALPRSDVTTVLNEIFEPVDALRVALVLSLTGGPVVALTASAAPSPDDVDVRARGIPADHLYDLIGTAARLPFRQF